jgi:hypothetical protein
MLSAIARKFRPRPNHADNRPAAPDVSAVLLPVVSEHLFAGSADLGAMLLKAAENTEVALIYHCTAMALHIAGTGLLLVRRAA